MGFSTIDFLPEEKTKRSKPRSIDFLPKRGRPSQTVNPGNYINTAIFTNDLQSHATSKAPPVPPSPPPPPKMWYSLIILMLIVHSGEADADSGAAACPYDFDRATGLIPSTCYPNYTGPDPANCCWFVSAAYLYAGILHSNATGEAFLPGPAASACSVAFAGHLLSRRLVPRSFVSEDRCSLNSSFSAGSRPCLWPSVSSIASAVSLSRPSQACTQKGNTGWYGKASLYLMMKLQRSIRFFFGRDGWCGKASLD